MDRNTFTNLFRDVYEDLSPALGASMSATEIVARLPLWSLPTPISAKISDEHVMLIFGSRPGRAPRTFTLPATQPFEVALKLIEEAYYALQEQRGWQAVETVLPLEDEPFAVIRELVLEFERRYEQSPFALVISVPAWVWLCRHGVHGEQVTFSIGLEIRSLPMYVTGNWPGGSALQVASRQRIARQISKHELVPLSEVPGSVKRSFVSYGSLTSEVPAGPTPEPAPEAVAEIAADTPAAEIEVFYTFTWAPRARVHPDRTANRPPRPAGAEGVSDRPRNPRPPRQGQRPPLDHRDTGTVSAEAAVPVPEGEARPDARPDTRPDIPRGDRPRHKPSGKPQGERHEGKQGDRPGGQPPRDGQGDRGDHKGGKPAYPKPAYPKPAYPKPAYPKDDRPKTYEARPPRVEKPIDPDNPFAVLAALKGRV